ncbi:ATP-binding protein [Jannaschia donghaensis]|uniref:Serine/threonine-protein kinase BtrW n=1 Tax=Jannaschia donghaensis TaxID=420998 RepID=A0A0M6YGR3_9RHOB|nr:ATP-binding protein [Jannaschia donghaensis]CTQ49541.1 Serine/threonine-protein kinase BtrW [Jannaschia donghaensis]
MIYPDPQADDPGGIVHTSFPACPDEISEQLSTLHGVFATHGLDDGLRDTVRLVLAEILNNIAEHAVPEHDGEILLVVSSDRGRLHILTEDGGRALPTGLLGAANLPDMGQTVDDLPEGGFGWFIIHTLVDDMVYERDGGMNRLSFSLATA